MGFDLLIATCRVAKRWVKTYAPKTLPTGVFREFRGRKSWGD
jgi:hypothetical protein